MSGRSLRSRVARLDWPDRLLFVRAAFALVLASLAIALLPFRWLARWLDTIEGRERAPAAPDELIRRCRWAIEAVSRRLPWRTVCFQQGLALHYMLRRRGIASILHYGVGQDAGRLSAHVWLSERGVIILGADTADAHTCLATFPRQPGSDPDGGHA